MRKLTLLIISLFVTLGVVAQTATLEVSTNVGYPEYQYQIKSANDIWMAASTTPTQNNKGSFAFFAADGDNAYKIYSIDQQKWVSYDKSNTSNNCRDFATLVASQDDANAWKITSATRNQQNVYQIQPFNSDGTVTARYWNWNGGVGSGGGYGYNYDDGKTVGIWKDNASQDGGSAWILVDYVEPGYYAIGIGGKYVSDDKKSDSETQRVLTTGEVTSKNIFYYDGQALIGYASGCGFEYACCNTGKEGPLNFFTFYRSTTSGEYLIKSSDGNSTAGWANGFWKANEGDYLERVDKENASLWTLTPVTMAAKIGEQVYYTFEDALAAAQADETITLVADVTCAEKPVFNNGGVVNVDINGHKFVSSEKACVRCIASADGKFASNNIKFVRGFGWEAYYKADEKFRVFPTLDEAVAYKSGTNAANIYPYENVVQNDDVVLSTAEGTASRICSDRGYDITWDLNGYTVEQKTASGNPLEATVNGKFTLDDTSEAKTGKWIAGGCNTTSDPWNGGGGPAFIVKGDGKLLLKGGTVSIARNTDANDNAIVNNNLVQINAGKLIVDGATLQCEDAYGIAAWGGNVVVNSGKFNIGSNNQHSILAVAYQADGYAGSCSVEVNTAIDGYMAVYSGATATVNAAGVKYVADGTNTIAPAVGEGLVAQGGVVGYPVAQIGETAYLTLEAAVAAATEGATITMLGDVTEDVTLPAGVTFNGNGKTVNGEVWAAGNLTFVGHTKATNFNAGYNKPVITIGEGACLELTGTGRMVIGHGATFNITGSIEDAKTADVATLAPSLIIPGASFTGAGVTFNVTNAYIKATAYCSSKNNNANGTFNFNVTNSVWEQGNTLVFSAPTNGMDPTFNLNLVKSVLNSTSHLVFAVTKGEIVIDNSNVNVGTSRQIENQSTMTIKNGSVVNGAVATSSNAKNPGTLIVENATYAVTGEFSGSDLGTGNIIFKKGASFTAGSITKANITIDATGMEPGEVAITAKLDKLAGELKVINNDLFEAAVVDGKIVLRSKSLAGEGTEDAPFVIENLDDLRLFAMSVNAGNDYAGKYVKLGASVDLSAQAVALMSTEVTPNWEPIGTKDAPFKGTFDGNGETISNMIVVGEANQGFFGYADAATIKNLNLVNVTVTGTDCVGAVAGQVYSVSLIDNCHVSGNIKVEGQTNVGGITGKYYTKVSNCSVIGDGAETSYVKGVYVASDFEGDNIGGIMGHCGENNNLAGNTVKNITVSGTRKVGGIVGIADQNTDVTGCVVENVVVETTATADYADSKVTSMSIAALIGQYQAAGSNPDGTVTGCTVKNVTFNNVNDVTVDVGPIVGGARGGSSGMLAPSTAVTASGNNVYMTTITGSTNDYLMVAVAKIGEKNYYVLDEAFAAAQAGETVTLVNNVALETPVVISGKALTLDLGAYTIEDKSTAVLTDEDNVWALIDLENGANLTVCGTGTIKANYANVQGGWTGMAYCINVDNTSKLTVDGGNFINGNGGVQTRGEVVVNGGTFVSHNGGTCIMAIYTDAKVTVNGGTFKDSVEESDAYTGSGAVWAGFGAKIEINGGTFDFAADPEHGNVVWTLFPAQNAIAGYGVNAEMAVSGGTFVNFNPAEDVIVDYSPSTGFTFGSVVAEGYTVVANGDGTYGVELAPTDVKVATLAELQAALADNSNELPIIITKTIEIPADVTVELNLNDKTVNVAWEKEEDGKHIYALTNNGTLTVTGNGTINTRGIFNYGAMTLTSGTINAIDGNGGYGVRNHTGATFTMDGGTIATTLEDDNKVDKGGYDATPVRVDEGATFTMNGGVINNICDFTVAIDNYGTTIIKDGEATTVHTTLANHGTMTINGGEFTCNGIEGITAHALWAAAGETTINGGTFNGKDNYNGFNVDASEGAVVNITGGTFLAVHSGSLYGEGTITVSGGTFFDAVPADRCAEGFVPKDNGDGTYGVVVDPAYGKVAKVGDAYYATIADAVAAATDGATVTMLSNVELTEAVKVVGKAITLDLNGKTVSGVCNSGQGHLIYIENGAGLTVKDGAVDGGGKLTYAQGTSNVGWTVAVMGNLTLESGTIELTGEWSIGYAVDVRPNAWSVAYTAPSVFTMNGGNVVSSDGAVRVASSSYDQYADVSASFVMNGGKIDAAWDGVFIQQSNEAYDVLNFTINDGTIESGLNPVRVYGPAPTSYVNGQECMSINFNGGTMTYTGTETREWVIDGVLRVGGGSSIETIVENGNITAGEAFAQAQALPDGYKWEQDGETYKVVEAPAIAKVGETYYATLADAVAAAEGETVTMLADVELTESVTIPAGKVVTLDLNGKTVSQSKECTASYAMITNNGSLTITGNGKLSFTDTSAGDPSFGWGSYTINNCGTLVVENGTIEHLGTQAFAKHMICAIFQYSGSTTINGGTISTPNYRSARLWHGDMTINGGEFDGQLWVQAVDNTAKLTVNGGTFEPNGNDASAVFVTNSQYDVQFAVTDGTFNGKVGCSDATKLAGAIKGGKFTESAMNNTNSALLAEGFVFASEAVDGYYGIVADPSYIAELVIDDAKGENYTNDTEKTVGTLTYKRTLVNGKWNALYLPFEVELTDELLANYDFADYNQMISHDTNGDRVPDSFEMELFIYTSGTLEANYPYFVRPKNEEACSMNLVLTDATLYPANEISLVTSSVKNTFKLSGTYKAMGAEELAGKYAISIDGDWSYTSALKPYRLYFTITDNNGAFVTSVASKSVRIVVRGEDGYTGVEEITGENGEEMIFDLQGRRVLEPEKGGIYIKNGKKIIF